MGRALTQRLKAQTMYSPRFAAYGVAGLSSSVAGEISSDQAAIMQRSRICQELAAAEQAEAAAADRLAADDRTATAATQQANDRARRADIAKDNHARAMADLARAEADAKATAAAAAEAKANYERALATYNKCDEEMKMEVAAAEEAAAICATAQRNLQNAVSTEANCAQMLQTLESDAMYPRYGNGAPYSQGYSGARYGSPLRYSRPLTASALAGSRAP